jgi:hypothetical protein
MDKDIFKDRAQGEESAYFRQQDAKLLQRLRQGAKLDEIAEALRDKLEIDRHDLLLRVRELGVTAKTASAFLMLPFVQVAWADGAVSKERKAAVLGVAAERGIEPDSPAYAQLGEWLHDQPSDQMIDAALEVIRTAYSVLTPHEREQRIERIVGACQEIANASEGGLANLLGLERSVYPTEASIIDHMAKTLRGH